MEKLNELILKGVEDGKRAFIGPRIVQIDLTGKCNNDCIGCWVHSPFIKNPPRDRNLTLPFAKVKKLIEDLSHLGTEEIFLSGAGEPFLHPNILDIIELIKTKGLPLNIITNFTLIDEEKARRLIDLGVDMVTASIWAALPETYIKTHQSKTEEDFYKIKDSVRRLSQLKIKENKYLPRIKIYNVICNQNYKEIQQMIDFALDTQVEFIEFQTMDIIKGETSFLALSDEQVKEIKEQFDTLTERRDLYFKDLGLFDFKAPKEVELKEFSGRFMNVPGGFFLSEEIKEQKNQNDNPEVSHWMTCPKGISTKPSVLNPICDKENNIYIFTFPYDECKKYSCQDCILDKEGQLRVRFLSIFGFGSFMRRVNSANMYEQIYEKDIIDNLPCYVGWNYLRVLSTGEIIPCCKAVLKPLGNIYKNSFLDIWKSEAYQEFRYKARFLPKSEPYFKQINCYKSCDNVGMNLQINEAVALNKIQQDLNYRVFAKREARGEYNLPEAGVVLIIPSTEFKSGNLNIKKHPFGKGIVIDDGCGFGFAEYKITLKELGRYELWSYYATEELRPVELYFDGDLVTREALNSTTSGWTTGNLRWFKETMLDVHEGEHTLKIYTEGLIPHIHSFAFLK